MSLLVKFQGRGQVLGWGGDFRGGGVSLRGVSLFVSRMLLPSFVFFYPKIKRPPGPLAYALEFHEINIKYIENRVDHLNMI